MTCIISCVTEAAQQLLQFYVTQPCLFYGTTVAITVITFIYYLYQRNIKYWTFNIDKWTSYEIERGVRCNRAVTPETLDRYLDHKIKGKGQVRTIYDCFMHGLTVSRDRNCLGCMVDNFTRYEWLTFGEVDRQSKDIGKFLRVIGLKREQCVGIYGSNSREWVMTQLACVRQSLVTVPLYDTLGLDSIRHAIEEVEMPAIFSDSEDKLKRILQEAKQFPKLKTFVLLLRDKTTDPTLVAACAAEGVRIVTWTEALKIGAEQGGAIEDDPPASNDNVVIQYTSGTTGISKGVVLTHANLVAYVAGTSSSFRVTTKPGFELLTSSEVGLQYLPLAHAYGQTTAIWFLYLGAALAFPSGNVLRLLRDAQILKPTYFPLVPRIMNRVYTKVLDETKTGLKAWLFWRCYERKRALLHTGCVTRSSIYDWLVFRKLQATLGGRVKFMTSGSAPIAAEVLEFWRIVFGAVIIEAYGQTETTAAVTCALNVEGGNVGHPTCCCMVRLLDLPELNYTNDNNPPQGEICAKGPSVTSGYFKRPELTNELFTPDGWLRSGDIGEFLPDGSLRVIDRRKHLFKLSQGEYIAPEKIESIYAQCPLVSQVFVDGDSLQSYIVGVVVPDEHEAKVWAQENGHSAESFADLCNNETFRRHVLNELIAVGKSKRLNSLEQIKSLHLHPDSFSVENGLLTPTMKNKRNDLRKHFKAEIEALYNAGQL